MTDSITSVAPYLIPGDPKPHPWWAHKPYVLVRIETSDGVVGWGECHVSSFQAESLVAMILTIAQTLVNLPAQDIRLVLRVACTTLGPQRLKPEAYSVIAGIEIALWDALGRQLDIPVYRLLGGSIRDSIPVYANIYSPYPQHAEDYALMALRQVEAGHQAIKLYPFDAQTAIVDGVAILQAVRDAVGPDIKLAVDLWRHADPDRAVKLARAMEPFDLLWIEDPFAQTDTINLRLVRDAIHQPLLTGETLPTRREFAPLFDNHAVDIINPDICLSGMLEIQAIAAMAEPTDVKVSPHNSNSMALGTAAAVHASLGIANMDLVEYFPLFETALDDLCDGKLLVQNGTITKPTAAGPRFSIQRFGDAQLQPVRTSRY